MLQKIFSALKPKMNEVVEKYQEDLRTIRTGKANPGLIDNLNVSYYGTQTPLKQMANISVIDATLITVQPWDANALGDIENALRNSNLGFGLTSDGRVIRLSLPPMTEERRNEFIKLIHQKAEGAKIVLRNLRKEAWEEVQRLEKLAQITEDDRYDAEKELNKLIEDYNKKIIDLTDTKEKELKSF